MKPINETGLPEFMELLGIDDYPEFDWTHFSVTTLQKGATEIILTARHANSIEIDIADMGSIVAGNSVHAMVERLIAEHKDRLKHTYLTEQRMYLPLEVAGYGTVIVTGKFDIYDVTARHLYDLKNPSASARPFKAQDGFQEYEQQLRDYWYIMQKNGLEVQSASNIIITMGHSKHQSRQKSEYPDRSMFEVRHKYPEVFGMEEEADILDRWMKKIEAVLEYKDTPDDQLPPCSPEDRWQRDEHWAIMKKGRKTAVQRCWSNEEAEFVLEGMGKDHYIEYRPGVPTKCIDWCSAKEFCPFYKRYMADLEAKKENQA